MSESSNLPEILDGFLVGEAIRDRHGILCCPAISTEDDQQYMIKILTLPVSQVQVEALLLSGAYSSKDEASAYYEELATNICREADVLESLCSQGGILPFSRHQILPLDSGVGCRVYLIAPYRRSVAQQMEDHTFTVREAIELGLDICSALSQLRQSGYLYADLKPENIFTDELGNYYIGDLGLIPTESLKYTSLPDKYRSRYTAPEMRDIYSIVSANADVYALGVILYQLFNDNELPGKELIPAKYADYALWKILETACHPDPSQRFEGPDAFGHALTTYLQHNRVTDDPIIPEVETNNTQPENHTLFLSEEENEARLYSLLSSIPDEQPPVDLLDAMLTHPEGNLNAEEDISDILAQADALINHELPQPVVAPTVIDVQVPVAEPKMSEELPQTHVAADNTQPEDEIIFASEEKCTDIPEIDTTDNSWEDEPIMQTKKNKKKTIIGWCVAILITALLITGGVAYFNLVFTQRIDSLQVTTMDSSATVILRSDIDDTLLSVVCIDTYGNSLRANVKDGCAKISGLNPNTQYRLNVIISGFHRLIGETATTFTTNARSEIMNFSAICGQLDGSAVLSFSVVGEGSNAWNMEYETPGEAKQTVSFTGTSVTVNGLTVGKEYTFTLVPQEDIVLTGTSQLQFTAQAVIAAENLSIQSATKKSITLHWSVPDGVDAQTWVVRCYNTDGYNKTMQTTKTNITFTDLDLSKGCTVVLSALGMTKTVTLTVPENPVIVYDCMMEKYSDGHVSVGWTFNGTVSEAGWNVTYTIDDGQPVTINCPDGIAILPRRTGSKYIIQLALADGSMLIAAPSYTLTGR